MEKKLLITIHHKINNNRFALTTYPIINHYL
jgi:hypothetical protein